MTLVRSRGDRMKELLRYLLELGAAGDHERGLCVTARFPAQ
jgi:hypothetical protein